jgi:retron-type reverse transcriptase
VGNLKQAIEDQGSSVKSIKEDLAKQQFFLEKEKKNDENGYGINTLVSQNLLRQRIRLIEKQFLDLKSNFLNYYINVF